jgi:hypothetical protein
MIDAVLRAIAAVFRAIGNVIAMSFIGLAFLIKWLALGIGYGCLWLAEVSEPARAKAWDWIRRTASLCGSGCALAGGWLLSVKDDLSGDGESEVSTVGLLAKLITIVLVLITSGILVVKAIAVIRGE